MSQPLLIVIGLALLFNFMNGMRDSSNIVATMISSRAFTPRAALTIAALAEFLGPFLFGVVVAKTIGNEVVQSQVLTLAALAACLIGAILWSLITWFFGIPSSSSHALIGGLIGAVTISVGVDAIKIGGLSKVLIALFVSPLVGFAVGFILTKLIYFLAWNATPGINEFFKRGQIVTAVGLALVQGTNDAQKTMGMITLCLVIGGALPAFNIPVWVIVASAASLALGAGLGGSRLVRTLGGKFYKIRPVHSFSSQLTSGLVILVASLFGVPVSATHVVSSAIIGVGSSERLGKVRWGVAGDILTAWVVTIPASALLAAGTYWLIVNLIQ